MSKISELIEKAKKLKNNQDFEEAIAILEDLYKNDPDSEEIKKNLIDILFEYGGYLNDDDYVCEHEKSKNYFDRIIHIDPNNFRAYYNLGLAHFHMEEFEIALKAYHKAIEINPDYKYCYYNIGLIYENIDKLKDALENYQKAINIDPKFVYAIQARKIVRDKLDRKD